MNFLALVKRLSQEADFAGSGPDSVSGQTGEHGQLVDWVSQAYIEIQNRHGGRWRWLKREFVLFTQAQKENYKFSECTDIGETQPINRFADWHINDEYDPPRVFKSSSGIGTETWMVPLNLSDFRLIYRIGTRPEGAPIHITVDNQDQLVVGPEPDDVYVINGWYWRGPQVLDEDDDVPEMPSQFHMLIVYYALEHYAYKYVAQEHLNKFIRHGRQMLRQLEANYGPQVRLAGPWA